MSLIDKGFIFYMKTILKMALPVVLLMTLLSGTALAQTKIATVDLRKLFDNYWKTKEATASIQAEASRLDRDDKDYKDKLTQGKTDYQNLLAQANDPALSDAERSKRKADADAKLKQLQESQTMIDQFERQAQTRLNEQRMQLRQKVLTAIQSTISAKAKAAGYSMVIDTGAQSISPAPVVLYSNGDNDLTDAVLAELNAGAPIDLSTPSTPSGTPSLLNTNLP